MIDPPGFTDSSPVPMPTRPALRRWGGVVLGLGMVLVILLVAASSRLDSAAVGAPIAVDATRTVPPTRSLLATVLDDREFLEASLADLEPRIAERRQLVDEIRRVYVARGHRLAWVERGDLQLRGRARLARLAGAEALGSVAGRHAAGAARLEREIKAFELARHRLPADFLRLEIRLTGLLLQLTRDLHQGRVEDPTAIGEWYRDRAPVDVVPRAVALLDADDPSHLVPEHEGYRELAEQAEALRAIVEAGGWPRVPDGPLLELGDVVASDRFSALIGRLQLSGDLTPEAQPVQGLYDRSLEAAVVSFQDRHGLNVDGRLGDDTLAALNVTAARRLRQVEANLERWRWLPDTLPADRIEVNIAGFYLQGYRDGVEAIRMTVAVGKPNWPTPIFRDEIVYAELNPYWNIPESIVLDEILPKLRENPEHLAEENLEVVGGWGVDDRVAALDWRDPGVYGEDYRIRQLPGDTNALGRIKFMFPNEHAVYLHDTPARRAFARARRAVSHGCVRVADPLALARFLFTEERLDEIEVGLAELEPRRVDLDRPMPVIFTYRTAFVEDGRLHFRDDIYGLDAAVGAALDAATAAGQAFASADHQRARDPRVST